MKRNIINTMDILLKMFNGEDVIENYNSERTAKAEYHKVNEHIEILRTLAGVYSRGPGEEKEIYDFNYAHWSVFQGIPWEAIADKLKQIYDSGLLYKKRRSDCLSVQRKNQCNAPEDAHYGFYFGSISNKLSGTYMAVCKQRTNTSKRRTIDLYYELIGKIINFYGLVNGHYLPSDFTVYSTQPTEWMYEPKIGMMQELLAKGDPNQLPRCSEKQALWISRKMNVDGSKLNKFQASELLDVLFNYDDNASGNDPETVMNHYKKILGIKESRYMKQIIRLTESDLHKLVKESVGKILKEMKYGEFGGPDADPHDLYPDMYPEEEEDDPFDTYNDWRLDHMGEI